jgi:hypothetical protein
MQVRFFVYSKFRLAAPSFICVVCFQIQENIYNHGLEARDVRLIRRKETGTVGGDSTRPGLRYLYS